MPTRVVLQDFTGVPAVVDLAAMRDGLQALGGDPARINPVVPADLVIDHSVQVDYYGFADAFRMNVDLEFERNRERYALLRWAQEAFDNFSVVPPGTGIVHQVNLEYLAAVIHRREHDGAFLAYPDTCVGTDSHTTMVNGLGVVGWGVGGIEAEAVMRAPSRRARPWRCSRTPVPPAAPRSKQSTPSPPPVPKWLGCSASWTEVKEPRKRLRRVASPWSHSSRARISRFEQVGFQTSR
jgi:hypothetical protein